MTSSFSSPAGEAIAAAIGRGATVCTATQRLARALHAGWIERMRADGRDVWPTPDILPYNAWLHRLVQSDTGRRMGHGRPGVPPRILQEQQELLTWEDAATAVGVLDAALQPRQLAAALMEAHAVALAWDIIVPRPSGTPGGDGREHRDAGREHRDAGR
ncbi:MAG: hypothetical protein RBU27_03900, partial [Bacteroidota bacterium]|nr:hypothetical protein [Bacteroidota bacterium]